MRRSLVELWFLPALMVIGCQSFSAFHENPTTVTGEWEQVWFTTITVLEKYFDVSYENLYDGRIETLPSTGPTLMEPWRLDAVGFRERLEGTLQTIRRRAYVLIQPAPTGGFEITVEVYKELEDLGQPAFSRLGSGTFMPSIQPVREPLVTSSIPPTAGWISLGRDEKLQAKILGELSEAIDAVTTYQ